jgi:hypothetical protein
MLVFEKCDDCTAICLALSNHYFQANVQRLRQDHRKPTVASLTLKATMNEATPVYLFELLKGFMTENVLENTRNYYISLVGCDDLEEV